MYVIIVYDVSIDKVSKLCQFLRRYLHWVQNSVFEGEVTESELITIKSGVKKFIKETDSLLIYKFTSKTAVERESFGRKCEAGENII